MILSTQNILALLLNTTFICSRADDTCPDVKLLGVGESDKLAILRGCPGTPGNPGLQGPPGLPGHKGDLGSPGKAGDRGLTGEKGDKGVPGQMGKLGPIGEKGDQGALGRTGDRGLTGQKGDKGSQGITGDTGLTGEKGDIGAQGKTGDRGLSGQKGDQGTSGKKGDRGLTGEKGSKGEKGELFRGAKSCKELRDQGIIFSGWYTIHPDGMQPLMVLCDMVTDGGGWIVFQRRVDGSEDFYQDWETYKRGFGNQATEFWLGNENIHRLTSRGNSQLRVDLEDFDNNRAYATYSDFSINGEGDFYRLKLDKFIEGTAEAEYVAAAHASQEVLWLRQLLTDLGQPQLEPTKIKEDNQGCLVLAQMERVNPRTKHIDVKYHFLRDHQDQGVLKLEYCPTEEMTADIFTKALNADKHQRLIKKLGLIE